MRRILTAFVIAVLAISVLALAGCSTSNKDSEKSKVWGYVTTAQEAQLELPADQPGATTIVVDRVLTPEPAWVVVHEEVDGKPGARVGLLHVDAGESKDLSVQLGGLTTDNVIVAIHADRGTADEFDFDMMKKEMSPDRPFFVDGSELAKVVSVK